MAWRAGRPPAVADTPPPAVSGGQPQKDTWDQKEEPHVGPMAQPTGQPGRPPVLADTPPPAASGGQRQKDIWDQEGEPHVGLMAQPTGQLGRQLSEEGIAEEESQHGRLKGQPEQPVVTPASKHATDAWGPVGKRGAGSGPASHPPTMQPLGSAGPSQKASPYARANVASSISLPFAKVQKWDAHHGRSPRPAAVPFSGRRGPREAERTSLDSLAAERWQGTRWHRKAAAGCLAPTRQQPNGVRQRLPQGITAGNSRPQLQQPEQQSASGKYDRVRQRMPSERNGREQRGTACLPQKLVLVNLSYYKFLLQ